MHAVCPDQRLHATCVANRVHQTLLTIVDFDVGINVIKLRCPLLQQTWKWSHTGTSSEQAGS